MRPDTEAQPHYPPVQATQEKAAAMFTCANSPLGCQQKLSMHQRDNQANLCRRCVSQVAAEFRVPEASVGCVVTALYSLAWYQERVPPAPDMEAQEYVRAQLVALQVPVNGPSPRELAMAEKFKAKCPWFVNPIGFLKQVGI